MRETVVGIGAVTGETQVLSLGPHHPSAHGALRLRLTVAEDRIAACEPEVGFMHRGAEKLFEVRDYRQILMLASRHDWVSGYSSELGVALVVEQMLGIEVPLRAVWTRTLLAELTRALAGLAFLGGLPRELTGAVDPLPLFAERETLQDVIEEAAGGRVHLMITRVGGLLDDLPDGWLDRAASAVRRVQGRLGHTGPALLVDATLRSRTQGVGVLDRDTALAHGVTGAAARAAGLDLDLRRDDPYLAYPELAAAGVLQVPTRTDGDAYSRLELLHEQTAVALRLATACIARLREMDPGPVGVRLPKILKAPEGSAYGWVESPIGVNGYYLVSRGEKTPWRLKLRTASFGTVSALPAMVTGARVDDLVAVLASMFFVTGDIDR
ncbi:MAG: NADH-quinone oxidoreductase subunit D [Actinomycetota bacterium]|nr:NADH-quinone oxidoreductase subunit D [Nocardioidaceae bacterium]MDQ3592181.1 NADH-quinone oxidoreductase subunit D [Actinomycetota bacterium]